MWECKKEHEADRDSGQKNKEKREEGLRGEKGREGRSVCLVVVVF